MKRNSVTSEDSPITGEQLQKYFISINEFYSSNGENDTQILERLFSIYDRNNDGRISAREMLVVMNTIYPEGMGEYEVNKMMQSIDLNRDSTIDFYEFTQMMIRLRANN